MIRTYVWDKTIQHLFIFRADIQQPFAYYDPMADITCQADFRDLIKYLGSDERMEERAIPVGLVTYSASQSKLCIDRQGPPIELDGPIYRPVIA